MNEAAKEIFLRERLTVLMRRIPEEIIPALAEAVLMGGVRILEITFDPSDAKTNEKTARIIEKLNASFGEKLLVGAGTVLTPENVRAASSAGAAFCYSPNTDPEIVKLTKEAGMLSIPGAFTPSEIMQAHRAGADFVKLFPITKNDIGYLKNVTSPLSHIPFICTGGVDPETIPLFFEAGAAGVGTGASIFRPDLVRTLDLPAVTALAAAHVAAVRAARG